MWRSHSDESAFHRAEIGQNIICKLTTEIKSSPHNNALAKATMRAKLTERKGKLPYHRVLHWRKILSWHGAGLPHIWNDSLGHNNIQAYALVVNSCHSSNAEWSRDRSSAFSCSCHKQKSNGLNTVWLEHDTSFQPQIGAVHEGWNARTCWEINRAWQ